MRTWKGCVSVSVPLRKPKESYKMMYPIVPRCLPIIQSREAVVAVSLTAVAVMTVLVFKWLWRQLDYCFQTNNLNGRFNRISTMHNEDIFSIDEWLQSLIQSLPIRKRQRFNSLLSFGERKWKKALLMAVIQNNRKIRHASIAPNHDFKCRFCIFQNSCNYRYFETCPKCENITSCPAFLANPERKRICEKFTCKVHIPTD